MGSPEPQRDGTMFRRALDDRVLHWIEGTVKTPYWDIAAALYFPPGCDECASAWLANSINADR